MDPNKHGLSRSSLNAETKRKIREQCNYGCVICRGLPYTYEHFDPEFKDAKEHNPDGMALLCGNHQLDTTAPRLDKEAIRFYKSDKEHLQNPAKWNVHHWKEITLDIGTNILRGTESKFIIGNETILGIRTDNGKLFMSGSIKNSNGEECVEFLGNEILVKKGFWDFTLEGEDFEIKNKKYDVLIRLKFDLKNSLIKIDRFKTYLGNEYFVDVKKSSVKIFEIGSNEDPMVVKNNHSKNLMMNKNRFGKWMIYI